MQNLIFLTAFLFSSSVMAQTTIVLNENGESTTCTEILLTRIQSGYLKVTSTGCSFDVSKAVAESGGYSLAELQRLLIDSNKSGSSATIVVQNRLATEIHTEVIP